MNYGLLGITAKELEEEINNARIDYLVYSTLKNLGIKTNKPISKKELLFKQKIMNKARRTLGLKAKNLLNWKITEPF